MSSKDVFEEELNGDKLIITRSIFNDLIEPLVAKTIGSCKAALKDASLQASDVEVVVMVGGSTRVPFVKEQVSQFFGRQVNDTVNPDEVVALGAAIQADILTSASNQRLIFPNLRCHPSPSAPNRCPWLPRRHIRARAT